MIVNMKKITKTILVVIALCSTMKLSADVPVVNVTRSNGELVVVKLDPLGIHKETYIGYATVKQESKDGNKTIDVHCTDPGLERCRVNYGPGNKPHYLTITNREFSSESILSPSYEMLDEIDERFSKGEMLGMIDRQISIKSAKGEQCVISLRAVWMLDKDGNGELKVFADVIDVK